MYLEKPKRPRRNASFAEVEQYNEAMAFYDSQRRAQRQASQARRIQTGPRHVQHRDDDVVVKVQSAYSVDLGVPTTDFIIAERNGDSHVHRVYDEYGNEIVNHRRGNS